MFLKTLSKCLLGGFVVNVLPHSRTKTLNFIKGFQSKLLRKFTATLCGLSLFHGRVHVLIPCFTSK